MNLLHLKNYNRLSNESVNKLIFIYVNTRLLCRATRVKQKEETKAASKIFTEPLTENEDGEDRPLRDGRFYVDTCIQYRKYSD
jgi:hypothetical protein